MSIPRHQTPVSARITAAARQVPLVLLTAPSGSGKAEVLADVRAWFEGRPEAPAILAPNQRQEAVRAIERIADGGADGCTIVAADQPQPFHLGRVRTSGRCREFGLADLALTQETIGRWSGHVIVPERDARSLGILLEHTEGWRGAWRVLLSLLDDGDTLEDLARSFSGAHPRLASYFHSEVLPTLDQAVVDLLLDGAGIGGFEVDLLNQVSQRIDALALLESAASTTGFVERQGAARSFRVHALFADFLRDEMERRSPQRLVELRGAAADWYLHRDPLSAARCYADVGNFDQASALIAERADELVIARGEISRYRHITRSMPMALRDRIAPEVALGAVFSGDFENASAAIADARARLDPNDIVQRQRIDAVSIITDYGLEHFDEVIEAGRAWIRRNPGAAPHHRTLVAGSVYLACYAELDVDRAGAVIEELRQTAQPSASPFLAGWAAICMAMHAQDLGNIADAEAILTEAPIAGAIAPAIHCTRAWVAWQRGDTVRAARLIHPHLESALRHSTVEIALYTWETAIKVAVLERGLDEALALASRAAARIGRIHGERGRRTLEVTRALISLRSDEVTTSESTADDLQALCRTIDLLGPGRRLRQEAKMLLARHDVLQGDERRGIRSILSIIRDAQRHGRIPTWITCSLIHAHGLHRLDEPDRAVRVAWHALERAVEHGLRATFMEESRLLAPMLRDLVERAALEENDGNDQALSILQDMARYAGRLDELETTSHHHTRDHETEFADVKLTTSELKILRLAARGHSNAEIAEQRFTGVSTVKWHMQNVMRKLATRSRTAAIATARREGLLK